MQIVYYLGNNMDLFDLRNWSGFEDAGGDCSSPAFIDQITIDSRRITSTLSLFVPLPGKNVDGHQFINQAANNGAKYVLVRKGWNYSHLKNDSLILLKVDDPLKAFQQIAKSYRLQFKCKVVALIGSYGKTMIKDLLFSMLKKCFSVVASPESFNSQIGVALSLLTITKQHEIALIEAGISHVNEMSYLADIINPDFAILTHIGKKHLPTLGTLKNTAQEMSVLLKKVPKENWVLIPHDPYLNSCTDQIQSNIIYWNQADKNFPEAKVVNSAYDGLMPYTITFPDQTVYKANTNFGFYYFIDLLHITTKAAWLLKATSQSICQALDQYSGEPTRTEIWQSPSGPTFINDTYCSDPQSIDHAFKHFENISTNGEKIFVFGGIRTLEKGNDSVYKHIGHRISQANINKLILIGNHPFEQLIHEIEHHSPSTLTKHYPSHQEAFKDMPKWLKQHDTILIKGDKKQDLDSITEAFNDSVCSNQCFINLAAIESNIKSIRKKIGDLTKIMVMVKAYAYGTNDIRMSKFLRSCGIDILGVSYVDEGVALRRAGVSQEIFVINAALYEMAKVIKWDLQVGVSSSEIISALEKEAERQGKVIKVHIHVDTGMSRLGCRLEEALPLAQLIMQSKHLKLDGIMTHFACADDPNQDGFTLNQITNFDKVINEIESEGITLNWKHAANSSGVMRFDLPQFNMVRVGLAVYGLHPSKATKKSFELELALSLMSRIVGINHCRKGETVSYGRNYTVTKDEQSIAVLPIGYFDGLHRNYSGKGHVLIRGKKAPMVGNICMDYMMVDVSDIPDVSIGDSVLIFGEDEYGNYLSPEDLATNGDSIVHELITCLGPRIHRFFIHEEVPHYCET